MSRGDHAEITCDCGETFKAWIWQSANVGVTPQLRQEIVKGTMNVVTCPACGARFHVEAPFLYHDPGNHEWIWVYPAGHATDAARVAGEVESMWDTIAGAMPPEMRRVIETNYKTRLLFGMDALVAHIKDHDAERPGGPDGTSEQGPDPGLST